MLQGAAAIVASLAMTVGAGAAPWCMTHEPIPAVSRPAHTVIRHVPFANYTGDEIKAMCGPKAMYCAIVMRASIAQVVKVSGSQRTLGITNKQCGQTPGGRACVAVIVVVPAGAIDYRGRTVDAACEADTERHELAHFFAADSWAGH